MTVYIHRALRTIGQHSIEGNIVIMIIYSYQLLGTTLVHPLASTGATPILPVSTGATPILPVSTGATPIPMDTETTAAFYNTSFQQGQSSQDNWLGPPAPKCSKVDW